MTPPVRWRDVSIFAYSIFVRSGEMIVMSSPRFVDLRTRFAPQYTVVGLCDDTSTADSHPKRRSRSSESLRCFARSAFTAAAISFVEGSSGLPRTFAIESSQIWYRASQFGFRMGTRSPVARLIRLKLPLTVCEYLTLGSEGSGIE